MAGYEFVTFWEFDAPIDRVWDEIYDAEHWPQWWKAVKAVALVAPGDASGIGAVRRYTWRGVLPYSLSFEMTTTRVEPCVRLEGTAVGELSGSGCWHFSDRDSRTQVGYNWNVETSTRWLQLLRPVARRLFEWNHDVVMRWGFEGLKQRLAARRCQS
jgi:hypothetical protein